MHYFIAHLIELSTLYLKSRQFNKIAVVDNVDVKGQVYLTIEKKKQCKLKFDSEIDIIKLIINVL